jgi:flavin-dependent dehydrogenase
MGPNHWDIVVVGAGPAGSVAAHALARRGLRILLVDRAAFPRWKVCGCCLNPFTLGVLRAAELADVVPRAGALGLEVMHLAARRRRAVLPLPGWRVLSRERLDAGLTAAAAGAGAQFRPRTHAALGDLVPEGRTVFLRSEDPYTEEEVVARLVLAADGLGSRLLMSEEGCAVQSAPSSRVGAGVVVSEAPTFYEPGAIYMAYGEAGYVGLTRLEDGRLNLAAAFDVGILRKAHAPGTVARDLLCDVGWPAIPDLADLPWRGTPALTRQPARPASARVLAVGDAAGYIEPFTGEGQGWAMASGSAVVPWAIRAVEQWQPSLADEWAAFQGKNEARQRRLCRAVTWLSRHPRIARGVVGVLGRLPWLAAPLVHHISRGMTKPEGISSDYSYFQKDRMTGEM